MNESPLPTTGPRLGEVVRYIGDHSSFQKKAIAKFLEKRDARYFAFAEDFLRRMVHAAPFTERQLDNIAARYLGYTNGIKAQEMDFAKTKQYQAQSFADVNRRVYSQDEVMVDYCVGLGMTQILWPNHWGIVEFFLDTFLPMVEGAETGAEIGCGHGLFHTELLRWAPKIQTTIVDISPMSVGMTLRMIASAGINPGRVKCRRCDIQRRIPVKDASLDALLLGEIVEHLSSGDEVMKRLRSKMHPAGLCFFTTAANAPAEDHILLFRSVWEILQFLKKTGWQVQREHIATIGNLTIEEAERDGRNINYAAILTPTQSEEST